MSGETNRKAKAPFNYGGQAVIEGVMMRGPHKLTTAVRRPDGTIAMSCQPLVSLRDRYPWLKLPVFRGVIALYESLAFGVQALMFSANESGEEDEELTSGQMGLTVVISFAIAIGFFMLLPTYLMGLLKSHFGHSTVTFNLVEGLFRMVILVAYIWGVSRFKDIQRVFAYHGAEHKVIHAHEAGRELTPANCREYSCLHPRCGTAFLLFVALVSIVLFSLFGWPSLWKRLLTRLLLLPVVAGLSFEVTQLAAKHVRAPWAVPILWPGLMLQKLTTREPDESMLEVAIEALKNAKEGDAEAEGADAKVGDAATAGAAAADAAAGVNGDLPGPAPVEIN